MSGFVSSSVVRYRWFLLPVLVMALALTWTAVAYAQTPANAQYDPPTATSSGNPAQSGSFGKTAVIVDPADPKSGGTSGSAGSGKASSSGGGSSGGGGKASPSGGSSGGGGSTKASSAGGGSAGGGGKASSGGSSGDGGKASAGGGGGKASQGGGGSKGGSAKTLPATGGPAVSLIAFGALALTGAGLIAVRRAGRR